MCANRMAWHGMGSGMSGNWPVTTKRRDLRDRSSGRSFGRISLFACITLKGHSGGERATVVAVRALCPVLILAGQGNIAAVAKMQQQFIGSE